jgi:hypothetical protein
MASAYWYTWYRSKRGFVSTVWAAQCRKSKGRGHPEPSYSKNELQEWLYSQERFHELFRQWEASNFQSTSKPSIDRRNDNLPYTLDNIELVSWETNQLRAYENMRKGKNRRHQTFPVAQLTQSGELIGEYCSFAEASRNTGVDDYSIALCARGMKNKKHAGGYIWKLIEESL